ncbi:hypothetical protein [Tepidimonas taiwanensis]|jgi:hypothetical protein|uniref:hypothetical protein n=1 Tax=Tepidimonas taiwanensis TaxID=307486 RepID=UPI0012E0049F|nr:hypothetical protein [Tepidimonas taiwanensis]
MFKPRSTFLKSFVLPKDKEFWKSVGIIVTTFVLLSLPGNWLASFISELVRYPWRDVAWGSWSFLLALSLVALLTGVRLLWNLRARLVPARVEQLSEIQPRRVFIGFLSTIDDKDIETETLQNGAAIYKFKGNKAKEDGTSEWHIIETIEQLANHEKQLGPWQQLARGILPHLTTLESVMLLPSSNSTGEKDNGQGSSATAKRAVKVFKDLIKRSPALSAGHTISVEHAPAADFEDFRAVMKQLEWAIQHYKQSYALSDMVIDVTGGQKTTSIAGALTTLDKRELDLQYVPTGAAARKGPRGYRVSTPALIE